MSTKKHVKKLSKLIDKSGSEDEGSEHELSYYVNDRVKLMKEVLKIIKPKKIKAMAPACLKNTKIEEINSMLLEELLGISNKRLKYIFNGQNIDEDTSSSTDPEMEKIDLISLDEISDDDFIDLDSDTNQKEKEKRSEPKKKKIKKEKNHCKETEENNLMSVLELLELQARARAIKSQLYLESQKKEENANSENKKVKIEDSDPEDDVIIEELRHDEIVITSSESENEETKKSHKSSECVRVSVTTKTNNEEISEDHTKTDHEGTRSDKETARKSDTESDRISDKEESKSTNSNSSVVQNAQTNCENNCEKENEQNDNDDKNKASQSLEKTDSSEKNKKSENMERNKVNDNSKENKSVSSDICQDDNDGLILNMDQSELECIICD